MDLSDLDYSQAGNPKFSFDLVDGNGLYMNCCAMKHNSSSLALQDFQEVILYCATGLGPIGGVGGMLYLMTDAVIVPMGAPRLASSPKRELLEIP